MVSFQMFNLSDVLFFFSENFGIRNFWDFIKTGLDISIVAYIVYKLTLLVRETRAWQLIKGIIFIIVASKLSEFLGLKTVAYIMNHTVQYIAIALFVVFQPEMRRALEQLGRSKFKAYFDFDDEESDKKRVEMINEITFSMDKMSKDRIGALIVIEKDTKLGEVINSGVNIESNISSALLLNIFAPNTPLHDGAVVIRDMKIKAAGCFLPLSDNYNISKELGTRHRAAIGISEVSDGIAVVVSEETGKISIAIGGKLNKDVGSEKLKILLKKALEEENENIKRKKLPRWKVKTK